MNIQAITPVSFERKGISAEKLDDINNLLAKVDQADSWESILDDNDITNRVGESVIDLSKSEKKAPKKFANGLMLAVIGLGAAVSGVLLAKKLTNIGLRGKFGNKVVGKASEVLDFIEKKVNGINNNSKVAKMIKNMPAKIRGSVDKSADYASEINKFAAGLKKSVQELSQEELAKFSANLKTIKAKNYMSKIIGYTAGGVAGIKTTAEVAHDENKDGIPDKFQQALGSAGQILTIASL